MGSLVKTLRRCILSCPHFTTRHRDARKHNGYAVTEDFSSAQVGSFDDIPEPSSLPIIGTALDYSQLKNFDASYLGSHWIKRHQELGPIYKENVIPGITEYIVYTCSPVDTEVMFRNEGPCPYRDPLGPLLKVRQQLGEHRGITNTNGKEWQRIRKIINQHFLQNTIVWKFTQQHYQVALDFVEYIKNNLDGSNEVPSFSKALNKWAFESTGVFALDTRLGALEKNISPSLQKMIDANELMFEAMGRLIYGLPFWKFYNTKDMKMLYKAHHSQVLTSREHMDRVLDQLSKQNSPNTNLQSILHSKKISKEEKLMLMTEFLIAGIDTTSNAASFVLYALATNPEKQEILRLELQNLLKTGISGKILHQAPYLHACIRETHRMYPFVSSTSRRLDKDMVLSGYQIPSGTHILNTTNMTNGRNPNCFNAPNKFIPERWLGQSIMQRKHNQFSMTGPFNMGLRMCPGRKFALQELQLLLLAIITNFRVEYQHKPIKVAFRLVSFPSELPQFKFTLLSE